MNSQARKKALVEAIGFNGLDLISRRDSSVAHTTAAPIGTTPNQTLIDLIIVAQWLPDGVTKTDFEIILNISSRKTMVWTQFAELATMNLNGKHCVVVDDPKCSYLTTMTTDTFGGLKTLSQASGGLWITSGLSNPDVGMVRALARTLRSEAQTTNIVTLAIDDWDVPSINIIELVIQVFERSFYGSMAHGEYDSELAVRKGTVFIPRFVHDAAMDHCLNTETQKASRELQPFVQKGRLLKLTVESPGFLNT